MIPPEAAVAVSIIAPYVVEMGKGAASKFGEEAMEGAGHVLAWMREKLTGRAKEALDEFEESPSSEDNQADLRKQLGKFLEAQPQLLDELKSFLPATAAVSDVMTQDVSGDGAKAVQNKGDGNQISIS